MKNLESSMSDRHIVEEISSKRLALLKLLKYGQLLALGLILGGIIPFIDYLYGFLPYFAPILHINSNLIYVIGFKSMWEARRRRNGRTSTSVAIAPIHSEKHTSRECAKSSSFVASQ
uniref:Uncharacterized protein n=2 Tax=Mucochytrium quahogii TaxID=96639 RepID=A0A7S2W5L2_9STRA|mmetsp:Transcript_13833/g.30048  ORF Transcript_13833/g.30048 Transcript_13833/m.30048 type:complete len:117 (+) Transcript_13833:396-746(+)